MNDRPVAIVTGAGSGIGSTLCLLLAEAGYDLALVSRTEAALKQTADFAKRVDDGARCLVAPADITDPAAPARIVDLTSQQFGRVDVLANVAGYAPMSGIADITADQWRRVIDTNLTATVLLTAAVWPLLLKSGGGVVVNVSSMASFDPFAGLWMYAAAKAGVNMFTQCTAREGAEVNIRAVCIAPGAVETPMLRSLFDKAALPPERTMTPAHVASVICDCITGRRAFEPGETIRVQRQGG